MIEVKIAAHLKLTNCS